MTHNRNNSEITTTSTTSTNTTTTTSTTRGRACSEVLQVICDSYERAIGSPVSQPVGNYLLWLLEEGMTPGLILDAIDQTAWAPRPSPAYLRAILQRYLRDGLVTAEDAERQREERRESMLYRLSLKHSDDLPI